MFAGNTTVFEYKTGVTPSRVVAPEVGLDERVDDEPAEEDIDWGDLDLDAADGKTEN